MSDGGDPSQASFLADAVKLALGGVIGYGVKWFQSRGAAQNKEIQACLDQLDTLTNDATHSLYAIIDGKPDSNLAFRVMVGRDDLGVKLNRAIGKTAGYAQVATSLGVYARTLAFADPLAGKASNAAQNEDIRVAQQHLRHAITTSAKERLWWRWSKHDVGK